MSVYRTTGFSFTHRLTQLTSKSPPPGNFLIYDIRHLRFRLKDKFCFLYICLYVTSGFLRGRGSASYQGWSQNLYHCKNQYVGKLRGNWTPIPPLNPPMPNQNSFMYGMIYVAENPGCVWPVKKTRQFSFRRGSYPQSGCVC